MALYAGHDVSFDNMQDCNGIREKMMNATNAELTNNENLRWTGNGCYTLFLTADLTENNQCRAATTPTIISLFYTAPTPPATPPPTVGYTKCYQKLRNETNTTPYTPLSVAVLNINQNKNED
jgi:hypothetical protein